MDLFVIYSTSYPLLSDLYFLFISSIFVVTYFRLKPFYMTKEIKNSIKIWKVVSVFLLIYSTIRLPWFQVGPEVSSIFLIMALILILYIALKIPVGLIITDVQLKRMYERIHELENLSRDNAEEQYNNDKLLDYLLTVSDLALDTKVGNFDKN